MRNGIQQYQQTHILTSSGVQLVVVLYDGAIQAMQLAREAIVRNNQADKARFLHRAVNVVTELSNVLDMERGGEIAVSLRRLYDYVLAELLQANLHHRHDKLDGPIKCLTTLREAWQTVAVRGSEAYADAAR
ncbi:flagellar protein FliS [Nitrospira sp.]|nr:flagellar protein FliS [Nitrospira sp.]